LAKAGNGKAAFVVNTRQIKQKVMQQLSTALQHAVTNVGMDWEKLKVVQSPSTIPSIFNGNPLRVYGFIENFKVGNKLLWELIWEGNGRSCYGKFGGVGRSGSDDIST
jgi:hypothetical protein